MPLLRPMRPTCQKCGGRVMVLPGLHARSVVCIGPNHCDPCCAECGTPLVLRDGDYDADCEHRPVVRGRAFPQEPPV